MYLMSSELFEIDNLFFRLNIGKIMNELFIMDLFTGRNQVNLQVIIRMQILKDILVCKESSCLLSEVNKYSKHSKVFDHNS